MLGNILNMGMIEKLTAILPFRLVAFYLGVDPYASLTLNFLSKNSGIVAEYSGKELWLATMAKGTEGKTTLWQNIGKEFHLIKIKSIALEQFDSNGRYGAVVTIDTQIPGATDHLYPQRQLIKSCSGVNKIVIPPDNVLTIESVTVYGRNSLGAVDSSKLPHEELPLLNDEILQWNTTEGWVLVTRHDDRFGVELTIYERSEIWEAELDILNGRLTEEPYQVHYVIQRKIASEC